MISATVNACEAKRRLWGWREGEGRPFGECGGCDCSSESFSLLWIHFGDCLFVEFNC